MQGFPIALSKAKIENPEKEQERVKGPFLENQARDSVADEW